MLDKDTPPPSPEVDAAMNEDEIEEINEDEIEEMIEVDEDFFYELENDSTPVPDIAKYVFQKHTGSVFCGALSNDGKLAATGGEDDKAFVWSTDSGEIALECTGHKDSVIFSDFSHDNAYLGTGDMSGVVQVWRMSDKTVVWDFSMEDITWMQWHGLANVLFAASIKGEIYMWRIPDGNCKILQGLGHGVECGAIFPDGKQLAVGYKTGEMQIMDLKSCKVLHTISSTVGHSGPITAIDCHGNNNLIISACCDGKTILTTAQNGKVVMVLQDLQANNNDDDEDSESKNWVETASFFEDPKNLIAATGTVNGEIFIWDIACKTIRSKIEIGCGISKLVWKKNTTLIYTAGLNGILFCHDGLNGRCVTQFTGHSADILDICLSKDGTKALTTSDDSTARIFEIEER